MCLTKHAGTDTGIQLQRCHECLVCVVDETTGPLVAATLIGRRGLHEPLKLRSQNSLHAESLVDHRSGIDLRRRTDALRTSLDARANLLGGHEGVEGAITEVPCRAALGGGPLKLGRVIFQELSMAEGSAEERGCERFPLRRRSRQLEKPKALRPTPQHREDRVLARRSHRSRVATLQIEEATLQFAEAA